MTPPFHVRQPTEAIAMKISRIASLVTILVCALAVAGCANTVRGAKRDINATADAAAS